MLKKFFKNIFASGNKKEVSDSTNETDISETQSMENSAFQDTPTDNGVVEINGIEYVDLGLSNGLLIQKEITQAITYNDMVEKNSDETLRSILPTYDEVATMINECEFNLASVNGKFYWMMKGPNGNYVLLPSSGYSVTPPGALFGSACFWIYDGSEGSMHPFMMVSTVTITIGMAAASENIGFFLVHRRGS